MNLRFAIRTALLVMLAMAVVVPGYGKNDFHLKKGATGKVCLSCHVDFQEQLKRASIHTPVRDGDCAGCHNPHTSDHGRLLAEDPGEVCSGCHAMIPETPKSVHFPVSSGNCMDCHDPHSSGKKFNLRESGNELCLSCHDDMRTALEGLSGAHAPVLDNCMECHNPHASEKGEYLLKSDPPGLCGGCHDTGRREFKAIHMNYPVADADCTSCHNPHGSNGKAILYDNVHVPVAKRMCSQCHEPANSGDPLKTRRQGFEVCRGCHNDMLNETFGKNRVHLPIISGAGCLSCHQPHASSGKFLVKGTQIELCGQCHDDTLKRQELSPAKHKPIKEGQCSACHNPHASDETLLAKDGDVIKGCNECHNGMAHSSHPIGPEITDTRNPNKTMDCLSCHRSHGTGYKQLIPFPTVSNLCVQCHPQYRR